MPKDFFACYVMFIQDEVTMKIRSIISAFTTAALLGSAAPAIAQDAPSHRFSDEEMVQLSQGYHIGYIQSGSNRLDSYTEAGLDVLAYRLMMDTRVPISSPTVVPLDLASDELNLFPFIYWTVTNQSDNLSEDQRARLQRYVDNGGILLIDTSDISTRNDCRGLMNETIGELDTRPFTEMPFDHTATKTFFLLQDFTSEMSRNPFCVERNDEDSVESLSNIVITDIGIVREINPQQSRVSEREREMLTRQLMNLVLYANTGDYKTDITHLPAILERMQSGPN